MEDAMSISLPIICFGYLAMVIVIGCVAWTGCGPVGPTAIAKAIRNESLHCISERIFFTLVPIMWPVFLITFPIWHVIRAPIIIGVATVVRVRSEITSASQRRLDNKVEKGMLTISDHHHHDDV